MPDATLSRLIRPTTVADLSSGSALVALRGRSMPDATLSRVLSGLQLLPTCRPDKALVPHPAINA
ncbi:hypothetical protein ACLB1E_04480 [Escherichia coli]